MIENGPQEHLSTTNATPAAAAGNSRRLMAVALAGMFIASTVLIFAITGVPFASTTHAAPQPGMPFAEPQSMAHAVSRGASPSAAAPTTTTPLASSAGASFPVGPSFLHSAPSASLSPHSLLPAGVTLPSTDKSSTSSSPTSSSPTSFGPVSEDASTSQNWYVNNWSSDSQVIQVGASNQSLALTGTSVNGLNGSYFFYQHGFTYVSTTSNGGKTWKTTWPGQASAWTATPSAPAYGDVNDGSSAIASDSTGDLFLVSTYAQVCYADYYGLDEWESNNGIVPSTYCNSTVNISAPEGYSFDEMPAGGGWAAPTEIDSFQPLVYEQLDFGGCPKTNELVFGNFTYGSPQIFSSANGQDLSVVVQILSFVDSAWTCSDSAYSSGGTVTLGTYSSYSTDGGASWSTVTSIGGNYTPFSTGAYNTLNGDEYDAWFDGDNSTAWVDQPQTTDQTSIAFARSTDNGATWSTPGDIDGTLLVNFDNTTASPFVAIGNLPWSNQAPSLTVDNWTSSPYSGNLYVAFGDNRTAVDPTSGTGDPSVRIVVSSDNGVSWGTPVNVTPDCLVTPADCGGAAVVFYTPQVAVTPNGNVWVTVMGYDTSSASTQEWVLVSTDAGATWSSPFAVSDTATAIGTTVAFLYDNNPLIAPYFTGPGLGFPWGNGNIFLGPSWNYITTGTPGFQEPTDGAAPAINGIVATTEGLFSTWTDCRDASNCLTGTGNSSIFAAYVLGLTVNASGANGFGPLSASVAINSLGSGVTVDVTPSQSGLVALDEGATVSAQTASSMSYNATFLLGFQEFSGGTIDTLSNPGTGTVSSSSSQIEAIFTPEPAGWINGTVTPTSANPKVYLNDVQVTDLQVLGHSYWFNETVLAGSSYTVSATATDYNSTSAQCLVNAFTVCTTSLVLVPEAGYLNDTITAATGGVPQGLTVTLESLSGVSYPFSVSPTSGLFHLEAPWGPYWLNATATGMTSYSGTITLPPGTSGSLHNLVLYGSHIDGTLAPINSIVKINGILLGPGNGNYTDDSYNWSGLAGTYKVTASDAGYSVFSQNVTVAAGQNLSGLNIILVNHGWFVGTVSPATATILVGKSFVTVESGKFNQSFPTGVYAVTVEAAGYTANNTNANITPGNATPFIFILKTSGTNPQNCTNDPQLANCSKQGTNTSVAPANNNALIEEAGIGLLIVIVVILAAVMLMRSGKGGRGGQQQWDDGQGSSSTAAGNSGDTMSVNDGTSGGPGTN
ncbi:MAG: glycoside hydrolase [Thermoplasmata archaeon]|nr:glycoside hydrolase [Thermoplasmata archaeon]